ncbi:helix-turn-helix domain-containing protein [Mucilaginibacter pedocola]|uniref:Bacteriophage CI repressor N-terminal domain-containing protein n=1 Tax=Mucilaginibacter pedocola TaxID=1792845 RepID=A0A1S9P843_9SPHI|nr:helix-turn-helix domain-containing protein [Mucilaginibacter pedocola]OOQ57125.1 hypothetical protein BC343_16525 [Mucilaginibacter pedocola]
MAKRRLGYNPHESKATVNQILDRLKFKLSIKTDRELAGRLFIAPNTLSAWRDRRTMDYQKLFAICELNHLDLNYIVFEKEANSIESAEEIIEQAMDVITRSKDKVAAVLHGLRSLISEEDLDKVLADLEKVTPINSSPDDVKQAG